VYLFHVLELENSFKLYGIVSYVSIFLLFLALCTNAQLACGPYELTGHSFLYALLGYPYTCPTLPSPPPPSL
jgi:hypothetical protein